VASARTGAVDRRLTASRRDQTATAAFVTLDVVTLDPVTLHPSAPDPLPAHAENVQIAEMLREAATLLEQQGANPFRVGAYRRAASTVELLDRSLREIDGREGIEGLIALPDVGEGIAAAIREILGRGRWSQLERLRGSVEPEQLFRTVPGIGPELAERIHEELHVDTLEALEVAAHDGRLERVSGIGPRRAAAIRGALGNMLGRRLPRPRAAPRPSVGTLLEIDREYREAAAAGRLPTIAPRRFNPEMERWLPILHTDRDGWHFTALFSNTARAHRLGRTRDWVVIYAYDGDHREGQATVVTETHGPLEGRRVVRGRERESAEWHRAAPAGARREAGERAAPTAGSAADRASAG
jgi:DNA polymerase (family X)